MEEHRKYTLAEDHPSVGGKCAACHAEFVVGDSVTLVSLGPGDDPEERKRARENKAYNARALLCHWACVTGEEDEGPNPDQG